MVPPCEPRSSEGAVAPAGAADPLRTAQASRSSCLSAKVSWPDAVVGAELAWGVCPLLGPAELRVASVASRSWRSSAAASCADAAARGLGVLCPDGEFAEALTLDSLELCTLAARSAWFDFQDFTLGLLVSANCLDGILRGALEALCSLPRCVRHYVRLPPLDGLLGAAEWIPCPAALATAGAGRPYVGSSSLRRLWSMAYVGSDGSYNESARGVAQSLLERWRALCCCSRLSGAATVSCLHVNYFQNNEVRGGESWKVQGLALGLPHVTFAGVSISYYDEDKHFVR